MIRKSTPFIIVIFSLLVIGSAQATGNYTVDFYSNLTLNVNTPITSDAPSFITQEGYTCQVVQNADMTENGTSFDYNLDYYSPDSIIRASVVLTAQSNFNCRDLGSVVTTTAGANGTYESRIIAQSTTGTDGFGRLTSTYSCASVGDFLTINTSRTQFDTKGNIPNVLRLVYFDNPNVVFPLRDLLRCTNESILTIPSVIPSADANYSSGGGSDTAHAYIYPFTTGFTGRVAIAVDTFQSIFKGAASNPKVRIEVVKMSTFANTTLVQDIVGSCTSCYDPAQNGQILNLTNFTLSSNSLYYLVVNVNSAAAANRFNTTAPKLVTIKVDARQPTFVCPAYSACLNGTQSRTCTDSTGQFPDQIQFQSCFDTGVFQELNLGFENANGTAFNTLECKKPPVSIFINCPATPQSLTLEIPLGWKAVYPETNDSGVMKPHEAMAFLTSNDDPYAGFKSLEMNYYPPMRDTVTGGGVSGAATCSNATVAGFIPSVFTNNLTASMVSDSFSFPPTNPAISWAVKRATSPRLKTDGCIFDFFTPQCYTELGCNSTTLPTGDYNVKLIELDISGQSAVNTLTFAMTAPTDWQVFTSDLNRSSLNASAKYRIAINLDDSDVFTQIPNRVFFDDFKIISLAQPLLANCTTTCDGADLIVATESNGICTTQRIVNESGCFDDFQESQQEQANTQPFQPIDINGTSSDIQAALDSVGLGFVGFFISPFFLYMLPWLAIGLFVEYKIAHKGSRTNWLGFLMLVMFGALSGTFITISSGVTVVPIAFGALIVLLDGALLVWLVKSGSGMGGSG